MAYPRDQIETDSRSNENGEIFVIPTLADILIMYSTLPGCYSYRNTIEGSWFIQELCRQLEKYHQTTNLLSILTLVIGTVAYGHQAQTRNTNNNAAKQLPHMNSQLTKILHFGPIPDDFKVAIGMPVGRNFTCNTNNYKWIFLIVLTLFGLSLSSPKFI